MLILHLNLLQRSERKFKENKFRERDQSIQENELCNSS